MHQDYSAHPVVATTLTEEQAGEKTIKALLGKHKGHYGPLEHVQIHISVQYVPHSAFQQLRTHRTVSFDCQSFRYTSHSFESVNPDVLIEEEIEKAIYLRPVGPYTNRQGDKYNYTSADRLNDMMFAWESIKHYQTNRQKGFSEEHCRGLVCFDYRQHFHFSGNMRSLMHVLDLRSKADVQIELQWVMKTMLDLFYEWSPAFAQWYYENRWAKARLAP